VRPRVRMVRVGPDRAAGGSRCGGPFLRRLPEHPARGARPAPLWHNTVAATLVPWRSVAGQDASRARLPERPPMPEHPALRAGRAGRDEPVPLPAALPRLQRPDPASVPGAPAPAGGEVDAAAR